MPSYPRIGRDKPAGSLHENRPAEDVIVPTSVTPKTNVSRLSRLLPSGELHLQ
jgi:hypothetical protein